MVLNFFAKISPNSSLARGHDIHCWNRLSLDIKELIVKKVNNNLGTMGGPTSRSAKDTYSKENNLGKQAWAELGQAQSKFT